MLYVRVSHFVVRGCGVLRRYTDVFNCDVFSIVNVYTDHLKLCVVCIYGRRYVWCGECNVVSNYCDEPLHCLVYLCEETEVQSSFQKETNIGKLQRDQNEALRIITGSHKMSSIDHIHSETKMIQVEDHLNLLSAQYLVQCLDTETVCHHITKMDLPPREMKETIFTRHYQIVLPLLANRKDTL